MLTELGRTDYGFSIASITSLTGLYANGRVEQLVIGTIMKLEQVGMTKYYTVLVLVIMHKVIDSQLDQVQSQAMRYGMTIAVTPETYA